MVLVHSGLPFIFNEFPTDGLRRLLICDAVFDLTLPYLPRQSPETSE